MNLARFARRGSVQEATPLEFLPAFSKALGNKANIWIKRDDLLPGAGGGNKTRKLDFSIADALAQGADTITETTGENTEQVQRRQDSDIEAIKEQLNTGFTGTTVTHTFAPAQLSYWKGYDGTGVPEGILDQTRNRLYL